MSDLPYGWNQQYAVSHALNEIRRLTDAVDALTDRLAVFEAELTRLDIAKQDRKGRKPQPNAQGNLRDIPKFGDHA